MIARSLINLTWAEIGIICIGCTMCMALGFCLASWIVKTPDMSDPHG